MWLQYTHDDSYIYKTDDLTRLPGVGNAKKQLFIKQGYKTFKLIKDMTDEDIECLNKVEPQLGVKLLNDSRDILRQQYKGEEATPPIDHCKSKNPYQSKFGRKWEKVIDSKMLVGKVCVTDLIDHIFGETQN